jgi:uncharacterized membrane protein HdeD (DUF308 family)
MATNNANINRIQGAFTASLRGHWRLFLTEGIALVILGTAAIMLPQVATFAAEILVGWLILISGIVGLINTFRMRSAPGFGWSLLSAILALATGALLLWWPLTGTVSLTLILSVFFVVEGIATIMFALEHKRDLSGRWGWMLVSGVIDLFLAGVIILGLPGTATWAIGLLVGINMVFGGWALIAMALHARTAAARAA